MRAAEAAAFTRGISAEALMEQAGKRIARSVASFFPAPGKCIVFAGKGHNAGDAFVAARWLSRAGWEIDPRLTTSEKELDKLTRKKLRSLRSASAAKTKASHLSSRSIILDGLLGLGTKPPLREPIRAACREINRLRTEENACVFAIDLPTGLDGDSGETDADSVIADFTLTVGFAKRGLVADSATNFVGRLEVLSLSGLQSLGESDYGITASADSIRYLLPRRKFNAYKNQFGKVGVIAGSKGFTGAATMCSLGALRAGAGLVELFVPEEIYPIAAAAAAPEVMVKPVTSYKKLLDQSMDVWAIGPGLGKARAREILDLVGGAEQPMVVDADGLNILAGKIETLKKCRGPRLLTPHPGEMKRIFPEGKGSRAKIVGKFCGQYPVTLLLKGSRTIVGERDRPLSYNTTGNPGMATGGMGDVLTGVCAALLAQKLSPHDAGRLGAWICGRAAEIAIFNSSASEESLLPCDVTAQLGAAFADLRASGG